MSSKISIREAERKAFTSSFQDGLWDIFIGCMTLQFAIAPVLSSRLGDFWSSAVFLPLWLVVLVTIRLVRKHVVAPRIGFVEFGQWRKARLVRFNVILFIVLSLSLVLGALSFVNFESMPGWVHTARLSLIILVGFSLAAYFLNFTRLYLYGVMIALAPMLGEWLYVTIQAPHHGFPITFGSVSAIFILTGLALFIRLLRNYPPPDDNLASEESRP